MTCNIQIASENKRNLEVLLKNILHIVNSIFKKFYLLDCNTNANYQIMHENGSVINMVIDIFPIFMKNVCIFNYILKFF